MARSRRRKETEEEKCRRKLRHIDYLSALMHARALGDANLVIYPCPVCRGMHVGHDKVRYAAHCQREGEAMITALLRRIRIHEHVIAKRTIVVRRLRGRLESIIVSYGCCLDTH